MKKTGLLFGLAFLLGVLYERWVGRKVASFQSVFANELAAQLIAEARKRVSTSGSTDGSIRDQSGGTLGVPVKMHYSAHDSREEGKAVDEVIPLEGQERPPYGSEFFGEIGLGESETLTPLPGTQIVGFDLWMFDKIGVKTETKVLVSSALTSQDALWQKLQHKGEIVPVGPQGATITINLNSIACQASVTAKFDPLDPKVFTEIEVTVVVTRIPEASQTPSASTDKNAIPVEDMVFDAAVHGATFDKSMTLELSGSHAFVGEIGLSLSSKVPANGNAVSAFELWMFDKEEVKTVFCSLVGARGYENPATRAELEAAGYPVRVLTPNDAVEVRLESPTLVAICTVTAVFKVSEPQVFERLTVKSKVTYRKA